MYPERELIRLARYRTVLRRKISLRRVECTTATTRVARHFECLDRIVALWRRLSPLALLATVPLGLLLARIKFPRLKLLGSLVRWGPIVFGAVRSISSLLTAGRPARHSAHR